MLSAALGMLVNCTSLDDVVSADLARALAGVKKSPAKTMQLISKNLITDPYFESFILKVCIITWQERGW